MDRLGIGYDVLSRVNKRIILAGTSGTSSHFTRSDWQLKPLQATAQAAPSPVEQDTT